MKKIGIAASLLALFLAPVTLMFSVTVEDVTGGELEYGYQYIEIPAGEFFESRPIISDGNNAIVACWEEPFWVKDRPIQYALDFRVKKHAIKRIKTSPFHECVYLAGKDPRFMKKEEYWMTSKWKTFPAEVKLFIRSNDGKPLRLVANRDGSLRVWLLRQSTLGDNFFENFRKLLEKSSHYKPYTPFFVYILFILWLPLMVWTGYRVVRLPRDRE